MLWTDLKPAHFNADLIPDAPAGQGDLFSDGEVAALVVTRPASKPARREVGGQDDLFGGNLLPA